MNHKFVKVHPVSCSYYISAWPYPFETACSEQFELCSNAFRRVNDNWPQLNQPVGCVQMGCAQSVAASWPIPPEDCSCAFSFVHGQIGSRFFLSLQMRRRCTNRRYRCTQCRIHWGLQGTRCWTVLDEKINSCGLVHC